MEIAKSEMLDTFGAPEYFSTHLGAIEDAGDGMLRVIRCVKRNGVLIPVCSLIVPAINILKESSRYRDMAQSVLNSAVLAH